jgi:hypothetical protein
MLLESAFRRKLSLNIFYAFEEEKFSSFSDKNVTIFVSDQRRSPHTNIYFLIILREMPTERKLKTFGQKSYRTKKNFSFFQRKLLPSKVFRTNEFRDFPVRNGKNLEFRKFFLYFNFGTECKFKYVLADIGRRSTLKFVTAVENLKFSLTFEVTSEVSHARKASRFINFGL